MFFSKKPEILIQLRNLVGACVREQEGPSDGLFQLESWKFQLESPYIYVEGFNYQNTTTLSTNLRNCPSKEEKI